MFILAVTESCSKGGRDRQDGFKDRQNIILDMTGIQKVFPENQLIVLSLSIYLFEWTPSMWKKVDIP